MHDTHTPRILTLPQDEFKLKYGDYSLYADPESKQFVASLTDFTRFK